MKILLVNDDGYLSEGINALEQVLSSRGHEIWVSAPNEQMSGKSHAMTIGNDLRITRFGENHYHMTGTPVDCMLYAKRYEHSLFPSEPDLVVSGINHGYNLASDITYSGTCGAAREAVLCSWKAIAVSSEKRDFRECAGFLADNLPALMSCLDDQCFLNLNFPPDFNGCMKLTIPGDVRYLDEVRLVRRDGNVDIVRIDAVARRELHVDGYLNDIEACNDGYASVSAVAVRNFSHEPAFQRLKRILQ